MLNIAEDGGIERFDGLHVDKIDNNWKPRQRWIEAGVQSYLIALGLRDEHQLPFAVSLGFSLEACEQSPGLDFWTREEFSTEAQSHSSLPVPLRARQGALGRNRFSYQTWRGLP